MRITLWGSRGSLATQGPDVLEYGGNTSCVEVESQDGFRLILDAGTGIRKLGVALDGKCKRVDILLSHLHMDHIQGLGFFLPLYDENVEAHIYGPANSDRALRAGLSRYLSPPLFPVRLQDLPCKLFVHAFSAGKSHIGPFTVARDFICHPGETFGYCISADGVKMAYMPDHETALDMKHFSTALKKMPSYEIAKEVDLLIHDTQYQASDYPKHTGWGHSSIEQALEFAMLANVKGFVTFHHDPSYNDATIDKMIKEAVAKLHPDFKVWPGREGSQFELS